MIEQDSSSQGYFTQDIYIPAYNPQIDPRMVSASARFFGYETAPTDQPFTYGDFGCGLGTDIILLAWALPHGNFFGIDINLEQIKQARKLAAAIGLKNVTFIHSAFKDVDNKSVPPLDYAVNTGVISWVSKQVRGQLIQAISRCLTRNGIVSVRYQTIPGTRDQADFRYLLKQMLEKGDDTAVAFSKLADLARTPDYFKSNNQQGTIKKIRLLQHEYISQHWEPVYPSEMITAFADQGLQFCGPNDVPLNISKVLEDTVSGNDPLFMMDFHTTRDNIGGRTDIFSKHATFHTHESKARQQEQNLYRLPLPTHPTEKDKQRLSQDAFSKTHTTRSMAKLLKEGSVGPFKQLGWTAFSRAGHILVNKNPVPVECSCDFRVINTAVKKQFKLKKYASWGPRNIVVPEASLILTCPEIIYLILSELSEVPQSEWNQKLRKLTKSTLKKKQAKRAILVWQNHWAPILAAHGVISPIEV